MFAICVESSHARGMGHLFRGIAIYRFWLEKGESALMIVNNDKSAVGVLEREGVAYHIVERLESRTDWETEIIRLHDIKVWINDRLYTGYAGAKRVSLAGALLISIDDWGEGAVLSEVNFAPMTFDKDVVLQGKRVLRGLDYCVLSRDVVKYRRRRHKLEKIAVTLGGSDTYGLTANTVECLLKLGLTATVFLGPTFYGADKLIERHGDSSIFRKNVPSLIEELYEFDCAVTGGGVTAIEAACAGLPTLIVANEPHERFTALHLESLGCARYLGFRAEAFNNFKVPGNEAIVSMSTAGINNVTANGLENMYREIKGLINTKCVGD